MIECSGTCINPKADVSNCGSCGTKCSGTTNLCSNGACSGSCQNGQTQCPNGSCADLKSDRTNCGTCGNVCASNATSCTNGSCVIPQTGSGGATGVGGATNTSVGGAATGGAQSQGGSSQGGAATGGAQTQGGSSQGGAATGGAQTQGGSSQGGAATGGVQSKGGSSAGGAATGGAQTQGGSSVGGAATGGVSNLGGSSTGTPTALSCTDPAYGTVSIPAINVISDFETNSLLQYAQDGRGVGADPWHAYAHDDTNANGEMSVPGATNPKNAANNFKVDTTQHGPCSTKGALHVSSPGPGAEGQYTGFGIDFMARTTAVPRKKTTYDASKYTGVGFWAKCSKDLQFTVFKTVDGNQDADVNPAPCSYSANPYCNQHGVKNAAITNTWSYYKLFFSEMLQDPSSPISGTTPAGVAANKLTAFQIHVNPFSPRTGTPAINPFDCYIDDVHFLSEAAPTTPAASVTWSTSGNKISRNGSQYKIRGLVRPSMEWDCSGFNITREDIKRMKAWSANAIRLAVIDTLWNNGTANGKDLCGNTKGGAASYQRSVKRVVNWILQEGMDVILDLHYVSGMPTTAHTDFWKAITQDSFFKDTRIIYELYNEPTGDAAALKTWMQTTVTAIRLNAPNNLILVGGVDWSYDISYYVSNPVTGGAIAYVTHPYAFKTTSRQTAYLTPAASIPVVATEFGTARVDGTSDVKPTDCTASIYSDYITEFEGAGMSWTSWAWIVDEWGCGFPQLLSDYSGTPNAIGKPVHDQLLLLP